LSDPTIQSPKVIGGGNARTAPAHADRAVHRLCRLDGFLIGWAFLFKHISVLWPQSYWTRLWRLALLIWFFSLFFFELMGPYNLLAEPLPLVALELLFWAICALGASVVMVAMIGRTPTPDVASELTLP
jgi:hypothetical protein